MKMKKNFMILLILVKPEPASQSQSLKSLKNASLLPACKKRRKNKGFRPVGRLPCQSAAQDLIFQFSKNVPVDRVQKGV